MPNRCAASATKAAYESTRGGRSAGISCALAGWQSGVPRNRPERRRKAVRRRGVLPRRQTHGGRRTSLSPARRASPGDSSACPSQIYPRPIGRGLLGSDDRMSVLLSAAIHSLRPSHPFPSTPPLFPSLPLLILSFFFFPFLSRPLFFFRFISLF